MGVIDLTWDIGPEEASLINELELMIPSRTTREYLQEIGYAIPDSTRAAMIVNSNAPLRVRFGLLERLKESTHDARLRQEIEDFLSSQRHDLAFVQENADFRYVYTTMPRSGSGQTEQRIFAAFDPALRWALKYYSGEPFTLCREPIRSGMPAVTDTARLHFSREGQLMDFHVEEATDKEVSLRDRWTFLQDSGAIPHPFRQGDIVWLLDLEEYGVIDDPAFATQKVDGLQEILSCSSENLQVILAGRPGGRPERVGSFGNIRISPIHMERYEPLGWDKRNGFDGMLLALQQLSRGEGSIETLRCYAEQHRRYCEAAEAREEAQ